MDILPQTFTPRRPVRPRGTPGPERRNNFPTENHRRLATQAGQPCPNCGTELLWDGRRLRCGNDWDCGYAWSKAESAEDEIYCGIAYLPD